MALTDSAPLLAAEELGLFRKHGVGVTLSPCSSWAGLRDRVALGALDAAQMLAPMPIAAALGLGGFTARCAVTATTSRNGNTVTFGGDLAAELADQPRPLSAATFAAALGLRRARGLRRPTLAVTFAFSSHNYLLRDWLASGGIDPDVDVRLVVSPPHVMAEQLALGAIDGFCAGEPWGAKAVELGIGQMALFTADIRPGHPEKVLAFAAAAVEADSARVIAATAAVTEAVEWLADPAHRDDAARLLRARALPDVTRETILRALSGDMQDASGGATRLFPSMFVPGRETAPDPADGEWWFSQMRRWGHAPDAATSPAAALWRADLWREAAALAGLDHLAPLGALPLETIPDAQDAPSVRSQRQGCVMRVVVIGAGPAGARCAERLARGGADVTLLGEEPGLPYDRVALSKFLAGDLQQADLITHREEHLAELGIKHLHSALAVAIDRQARRITLGDGRALEYDTAVLAIGSDPFRLPLPGAELPGVLMYRTLSDVLGMLRAAEAGGRAIVIGGGLLGLEAAVGLAKRGMKAMVLHGVSRLMERQLDDEAAARLRAHLERTGIITVLEAKTVSIDGVDRVEAVSLADGTRIPTDLVVMAVGIRPRVALAREAGLTVARGIVVDSSMRTSDPSIFAVGECAEVEGACCGLVAPAFAQAEIAARVLMGEEASYIAESDATVLKVAGAPVWSAGEIEAGDSDVIVLDDPEGPYRRLLLRGDRLVGAILWGDTDDAAFYRNLIRRNHDVSALRGELAFGAAFAPAELRA